MKHLLVNALLGVVLSVAQAAGAQSSPDAVTPDAQATPDQTAAIVSDFGKGAEAVTARLKDLDRSLADVPALEALEAEVATYAHRTATHWHETSRLLGMNLRTTALDSLTTYWQALHTDLDDVDARIAARVKRRDAELASLATLRESLTHAVQVARDAGTPAAVVERVHDTIAATDRMKPRLEQRRARLLVMQNAVSRAYQHCADALSRIADARDEAISRMFTPQEPPFWRSGSETATAWSGSAFGANLDSKADSFRMYVSTYRGRLVLSVLVIVALIGTIRWASHRLAQLAAAGAGAAGAATSFRTPIASGLLAGLLVTVPLRPSPPYEFQQAMLAVVLAASASVFRSVLTPRLRAAFYAACGLYALHLVSQVLEPTPRVEQLLLILQMTAMCALLLWGARQAAAVGADEIGASLLSWVMRILADVIAIACGLSAVAAALGYLDFADLLGIGLMLALLVSVALLAVRTALDDLVSVALAHGPIARLRTVARHREVIGRGVRSVLDACILAVWVWLVLGRFQLRDPLLERLGGVLGTTLRAGGLELPLGHVLSFVVLLVVVFAATRVLVVVLEEDVFSRMTLPRGVPYALSTLTRYTMLLTGFLIALGALGLDLTRITVLVSALGLGLGFGLQQIMNNFVSGLILLFERPVQVGDSIQMDGLKGDVLRIGIRSSTVRTGQGAEVIVPNSKLIEEKVTNWTLSDRRRRCELDLSVAADDDVERVMRTIVEIAQHHPKVVAAPAPEALLVRLGRNSNHYQLRFWTDGSGWARVCSDLAVELHRTLRGVRTLDPTAPPAPPAKR